MSTSLRQLRILIDIVGLAYEIHESKDPQPTYEGSWNLLVKDSSKAEAQVDKSPLSGHLEHCVEECFHFHRALSKGLDSDFTSRFKQCIPCNDITALHIKLVTLFMDYTKLCSEHKLDGIDPSDLVALDQAHRKISTRAGRGAPTAQPQGNGHSLADSHAFPSVSSEQMKDISDVIKSDPDKTELLEEYILQSLAFPQMGARDNEVSKASDDSYGWLLEPESNFISWLEDQNEETYWINGKPGCGKSTLMRFVSTHEITTSKLKSWSGEKPFTIVSYYFWTSGTKDQRSQAGLLRSLLHQFLSKHRQFIPGAIPDLWLKLWKMSTMERVKNKIIWELDELLMALRLFFGKLLESTRVVLFVDGLDEFEGDHHKIVEVFNSLVRDAAKFIKLCVSSRSEPIFIEAYQGRPQFRLQDYTLPDITMYYHHTLLSDTDIKSLYLNNPGIYLGMVADLVIKANGVFLWATLTAKHICDFARWMRSDGQAAVALRSQHPETNTHHDALLALLSQLVREEFPGDLDDLFHWLVYKQQRANPKVMGLAVMILKAREVVIGFTGDQTTSDISLWDLTAASVPGPGDYQQGVRRPVLMDDTESPVASVDLELLKRSIEFYSAGLSSAGAGLLSAHVLNHKDIYSTALAKVTYTHRTVKDWLDQPEVERRLTSTVIEDSKSVKDSDYIQDWLPHSINLGICQYTRRQPVWTPRKGRNINELWPFVVLTMTHARMAEAEIYGLPSTKEHALQSHIRARYERRIIALNEALSWYWRKSPGNPDDTWAKNAFGSYEERRRMIFKNPFFSVCARFGLREYILSRRENQQAWSSDGAIPLLSYAVEFLVNRKRTVYPLSDPAFVRGLLQRGFDHGEQYQQFGRTMTPWLFVIESLQQAERRGWIVFERAGSWVDIVNTFLDFGASLHAKTVGWFKDPAVEAGVLLRQLKDKYELDDLMV